MSETEGYFEPSAGFWKNLCSFLVAYKRNPGNKALFLANWYPNFLRLLCFNWRTFSFELQHVGHVGD